MKVPVIIDHFNTHRSIPTDDITWILSNKRELYNYFHSYRNRDFAIGLLTALIILRKPYESNIYIEDLMFACFIVTLHKNIEDCLLIWEAKNADFDTYCGLDIQLVPFMGLPATIAYLQASNDPEAKKALDYINKCYDGGDFEELENYYSNPDLTEWLVS